MKRHSIVLPLLILVSGGFSDARVYGLDDEISDQAVVAIQDFFSPSDRKIDKIKVQSITRLNSTGIDYLVESAVWAQSAHRQQTIEYHCGVFLKRVRAKWVSQHTQCEPLEQVNFY